MILVEMLLDIPVFGDVICSTLLGSMSKLVTFANLFKNYFNDKYREFIHFDFILLAYFFLIFLVI